MLVLIIKNEGGINVCVRACGVIFSTYTLGLMFEQKAVLYCKIFKDRPFLQLTRPVIHRALLRQVD